MGVSNVLRGCGFASNAVMLLSYTVILYVSLILLVLIYNFDLIF